MLTCPDPYPLVAAGSHRQCDHMDMKVRGHTVVADAGDCAGSATTAKRGVAWKKGMEQ